MSLPNDLKYTKEHEWVRVTGNVATVGVTDFAQSSLGDVVFCELPAVGAALVQNKNFGVVESVKAVSDLYAPVSGKVVETNPAVVDNPSLVNTDPYGAAWMVKVELQNPGELGALMDAAQYQALLATK